MAIYNFYWIFHSMINRKFGLMLKSKRRLSRQQNLTSKSPPQSYYENSNSPQLFHYLSSRRKPSFIWRHFSNTAQCALTRQKHTFTRTKCTDIVSPLHTHATINGADVDEILIPGRDLHTLLPLSCITAYQSPLAPKRHCRMVNPMVWYNIRIWIDVVLPIRWDRLYLLRFSDTLMKSDVREVVKIYSSTFGIRYDSLHSRCFWFDYYLDWFLFCFDYK